MAATGATIAGAAALSLARGGTGPEHFGLAGSDRRSTRQSAREICARTPGDEEKKSNQLHNFYEFGSTKNGAAHPGLKHCGRGRSARRYGRERTGTRQDDLLKKVSLRSGSIATACVDGRSRRSMVGLSDGQVAGDGQAFVVGELRRMGDLLLTRPGSEQRKPITHGLY